MYQNRDKLVLKLKVASSPADWRKDANYILGTKQINNIVHQSLHTFSIPPWGLPFPFLPAEAGTTSFFLQMQHCTIRLCHLGDLTCTNLTVSPMMSVLECWASDWHPLCEKGSTIQVIMAIPVHWLWVTLTGHLQVKVTLVWVNNPM